MEIRVGPPVSGSNCFPRPDVVERLRRALHRGHVSLMAPRRTGKTSLLIHLEETAPEGHPHWRINLETCARPAEWLAALMEPFVSIRPRWRSLVGQVRSQLDRFDGVEIAGLKVRVRPSAWQRPAEQFLGLVRDLGLPITFLLDEFPILVRRAAEDDRPECEAMLRWFREWRQRTADDRIRFLVTGSIGLDTVVKRHGLWDTVNDFDRVELPPLSSEDALLFALQLAADNGVDLTVDAARRALELLGPGWPYAIQVFVAELQDAGGAVSVADVERLYRERLVDGPRNEYVKHMFERLREVFSAEERRLADALLGAVATRDEGLRRSELESVALSAAGDVDEDHEQRLDYVLDVLRHDGYLVRPVDGDGRTRFFSNLLRDSWVQRRV